MRVAVDAMGGDTAPDPLVKGAVDALHAADLHVALVGDEPRIRACLPPMPESVAARLSIEHTADAIGMHEPGTQALRRADASVCLAARMVADGRADAIVTMGNTSAASVAGVKHLKCIAGVKRPALALCLPNTTERPFLLLDAGATSDCTAEMLMQFAYMGAAYVRGTLGVENARVGLVSIGEESSKGNDLGKASPAMLKESGLNFVGNVEPTQLARGEADVGVCDGFTGNIFLKALEAFAELTADTFRKEFGGSLYGRLAALVARPILYRVFRSQRYDRWGGAVLLGVNGIFVIGHGRSNALAVRNAVLVASDAVRSRVVADIERTTGAASG